MTFTKGCWRRGELAWTISATFSLPEPLGPEMSTGASARATLAASETTRCMASLA